MKRDIVIVIPAYNPTKILTDLVHKLFQNEYINIIVIDDGSKEKNIFESIKEQVILIEHKKNEGKGQALKTGFAYCRDNLKRVKGIITIDADGQHKVKDVNKLYEKFKEDEQSLVLGSRNFKNSKVPIKSKIGNNFMKKILSKKTNYNINDTQTGLRAIPISYIDELEALNGERFEYEMNMLLYFINKKINIKEVQIETVYRDENKASNFKAIIDSIKIYITFIRNYKHN